MDLSDRTMATGKNTGFQEGNYIGFGQQLLGI